MRGRPAPGDRQAQLELGLADLSGDGGRELYVRRISMTPVKSVSDPSHNKGHPCSPCLTKFLVSSYSSLPLQDGSEAWDCHWAWLEEGVQLRFFSFGFIRAENNILSCIIRANMERGRIWGQQGWRGFSAQDLQAR